MAKPNDEQRRTSDKKRAIIINRINRAGDAKRAIQPIATRKRFHEILDRASQPIKREVETDSESSET